MIPDSKFVAILYKAIQQEVPVELKLLRIFFTSYLLIHAVYPVILLNYLVEKCQ